MPWSTNGWGYQKMNIANKLTLSRIILIPFFMICLQGTFPYARFLALLIFVVASATDWLDGHLARKYNLITKFGQLMDPLADKLLVMAALIGFVENGTLPAWVAVVILARELLISIFRAVAASEGIVIAASKWGKYKTVSQMVMIILMLMNNFPFAAVGIPMDRIFMWLAVALTLISGWDYLYKNRAVLAEGGGKESV